MKKLQNSFVNSNDSIVQFISISIDPARDSVPQLRKFADRYTFNHDSWWFATGDKQDIYDFAFNELKASVADAEIDTAFIIPHIFSCWIATGWCGDGTTDWTR
jgi:protein SCO1/2